MGVKANKTGNVSNYFKFFALLGDLFQARFLRPLWQRYPSCEKDPWEAACLFASGYAFERQGAKPDYNHIAVEVIKGLAMKNLSPSKTRTVQLGWKLFCKYAGNTNLNYGNNPFCPEGTSYSNKVGSGTTSSKSILEFMRDVSNSGFPPNVVSLAKTGLQANNVKGLHYKFQEINGIGPKIASLFLRDVAIVYNIFPGSDRHLLQPVDVWVRRACEKLSTTGITSPSDTEIVGKWIVAEAHRAGVQAESVNQGMWYFSSQIADSDYRMSRALDNLEYAKVLFQDYIQAIQQEAIAGKALIKSRWQCLKNKYRTN